MRERLQGFTSKPTAKADCDRTESQIRFPEHVEGLYFSSGRSAQPQEQGQWLVYGRLRLDELSIDGFEMGFRFPANRSGPNRNIALDRLQRFVRHWH